VGYGGWGEVVVGESAEQERASAGGCSCTGAPDEGSLELAAAGQCECGGGGGGGGGGATESSNGRERGTTRGDALTAGWEWWAGMRDEKQRRARAPRRFLDVDVDGEELRRRQSRLGGRSALICASPSAVQCVPNGPHYWLWDGDGQRASLAEAAQQQQRHGITLT
jgi:hypothetical protein